jgi:hypothetical protein
LHHQQLSTSSLRVVVAVVVVGQMLALVVAVRADIEPLLDSQWLLALQ